MADAVETVIFAAPNVLWLADGDTGYGKALAVQKTIRAYARRGGTDVDGLSIFVMSTSTSPGRLG